MVLVRQSVWALVWAAAAAASSAWGGKQPSTWGAVDDKEAPGNIVAGAFIIECETGQDIEPLVKAIQQQDGQVRRKFDSSVFYGISVRLAKVTEGGSAEIRKLKGVKNMWPVQLLSRTAENKPGKQPEQQPPRRRRVLAPRAAGEGVESPWHHVMTQVDKLHAEGLSGNGIKIAVVDTGVDYTHPALGGCFGQGCRVAIGDNLSNVGEKGDPMDPYGHGTEVAGILAGYDKRGGFVGVAPNATLAAYRVVKNETTAEEDDVVAGFLKAYEDGAQIIASSAGIPGSSWAHSPAAAVASRIAASGVPCIVGSGNDKKEGLFFALNPATGRGVIAVNSFANKRVAPEQQGANRSAVVETGGMSGRSAYGPTWDLDIKPNLGAPGDDIPCPELGGGYAQCTGTSYSAPLVAGIVALIAERRRSFDPALLNSLLVATAEPQKDDGHIPVVQQGGGLVRAWDAAHATTVVEPAGLTFNDTDHRVPSIGLRITNTAKSEVVYQLSNIPARTLYARREDDFKTPDSVQAAATVNMSKSSITLGPGQSATIDISAEDPKGLDPKRLPVWSGWVAVNGSDGNSLTIPYLGLAGSLHEHHVLTPNGAELAYYSPLSSSKKTHDEGERFNYEMKDGALGLSVPLLIKLRLGSLLVRAEVVPVSLRKWLAERLGNNKSLPINGFPLRGHLRHSDTFFFENHMKWNGQLEWGDYVPVGEYKFVVRALRIFGDPKVESDWEISETVRFEVFRGAGEEACKIYQSGKAKVPENSLFQSHEECLQVHGKMLADAPWVPEPRDKSVSDKCSDDNPTEEACGTYRYCKAHEGRPDIKSPFRNKRDCVEGHKLLPNKELKDLDMIPECLATKEEDICGTNLWCYGAAEPTDEYGSIEECWWAHGLFI